MTITIKGDLILEKDTTYEEGLIVEGNIFGKDEVKYNLIVKGNLNCWDLNCDDLNCWDLNCKNLNCWDLNCDDLNCDDLNCKNLNCWDLNCRDLDCWNLNCGNLDCKGNVSYWAIAFAYYNIKCKSIKGRRNPCKEPFVLEGKIEITEGKK